MYKNTISVLLCTSLKRITERKYLGRALTFRMLLADGIIRATSESKVPDLE